jgi:hypothetical protein
MEGDFYVVEIPRKGLRNAQITWLDERGRPPGPGMYVPGTVAYGPGPGTAASALSADSRYVCGGDPLSERVVVVI